MTDNCLATTNILLRGLDEDTASALQPYLTRIEVAPRHRFHVPAETIETIAFPESGVISCVIHDSTSRTEAGLIGREGVTGVAAILGDRISATETFVQVDFSTALLLQTDDLEHLMETLPGFRDRLLRYASTFMAQLACATASCANQHMEARLARWLLMCHDRTDGDQLALTHEFMGMMISAQRSGVTVALHSLEGAGMIRSTRGMVTIRDRKKLCELAGDSYGLPETRYRALIGPFGK